jgi:hypothetical protein
LFESVVLLYCTEHVSHLREAERAQESVGVASLEEEVLVAEERRPLAGVVLPFGGHRT